MKASGRLASVLLVVIIAGSVTGCPPVCYVLGGSGDPCVELTVVPALGSHADLYGTVTHVNPCLYRVAVYIYVEAGGGWWNKPLLAAPLTEIANDGTWTADITTGGTDEDATKIAVFLVPADCEVDILEGAAKLPTSLLDAAIAHDAVERGAGGTTRLLYFGGYEWWVKASDTAVGPGPNLFSDSRDNVWLDSERQLHLKITKNAKNGDTYECAEVVCRDNLGYGTYVFSMASRVDNLDPNCVLGLFTWSDDPAYNYREMDIELSRWGNPLDDNAQFVVQLWDTPGNLERFNMWPCETSVHGFNWQADAIAFRSVCGEDYGTQDPNLQVHDWLYEGEDIPVPGSESARINLWLAWGNAPQNEEEAEAVVADFQFIVD